MPNPVTPRIEIVNAYVFVDWNTQTHGTASVWGKSTEESLLAECVFSLVLRKTSLILLKTPSNMRFNLHIRGYHGWHKGYQPTDRRKAVQTLANEDLPGMITNPRVLFRSFNFGDKLVTALPKRLSSALGCHLPGTLRTQSGRAEPTEKMVDTALASDLVALASQERDAWYIVFGEDIDLVPPVFVAEAFLEAGSGRVVLSRKRKRNSNELLALDGLVT